MTDQKKKNFSLGIIIVVIAGIAGLVMVNRWIQARAEYITTHPVESPSKNIIPPPKTTPDVHPKKRAGEVTRKTRFAPDRTYRISVFYSGGEEIARHKVSNEKVYDQEGQIPDGRVKFLDASDATHGVERYHGGKKHGPTRIYYKDGRIKQEDDYQYGTLMTRKEYYSDGTLRMEENYYDARDPKEKGQEVGVGQVYFRNGIIKYEWHMTNSDPIGFYKSYNRMGQLVDAVYFNENSDIIPGNAL